MNYSLYAESTPNPDVMKFVSNKILVNQNIEILSNKEAERFPIAKELFNFPFVQSIFLSSNYIAIRKTNQVEWQDIAMQLRSFIVDFLNKPEYQNNIISDKNPISKDEILVEARELTEDEKEISEIINQYIAPAVESDGGSITLESFDKGIVKLNLSGACSGCPSASLTLKQGVESLLKEKLGDKIKDVVAKES